MPLTALEKRERRLAATKARGGRVYRTVQRNRDWVTHKQLDPKDFEPVNLEDAMQRAEGLAMNMEDVDAGVVDAPPPVLITAPKPLQIGEIVIIRKEFGDIFNMSDAYRRSCRMKTLKFSTCQGGWTLLVDQRKIFSYYCTESCLQRV